VHDLLKHMQRHFNYVVTIPCQVAYICGEYGVKVLVSQKRCDIVTSLLQTTNRK